MSRSSSSKVLRRKVDEEGGDGLLSLHHVECSQVALLRNLPTSAASADTLDCILMIVQGCDARNVLSLRTLSM